MVKSDHWINAMVKNDLSIDATLAYWTAQHDRHMSAERQTSSARRGAALLPRLALLVEFFKGDLLPRLSAIRWMISASRGEHFAPARIVPARARRV
jgi:hypothetical protein